MNDDFKAAVTQVLASLGKAEVVSFGEVARRAGYPKHSRAVGRFLSEMQLDLPWWRVVYSDGRLPPCAIRRQIALLKAEGVVVEKAKVSQTCLAKQSGGKENEAACDG